jgi:hypothetical protein
MVEKQRYSLHWLLKPPPVHFQHCTRTVKLQRCRISPWVANDLNIPNWSDMSASNFRFPNVWHSSDHQVLQPKGHKAVEKAFLTITGFYRDFCILWVSWVFSSQYTILYFFLVPDIRKCMLFQTNFNCLAITHLKSVFHIRFRNNSI